MVVPETKLQFKNAIVITTIQPPTECVKKTLAKFGAEWQIYIAGDRKGPTSYSTSTTFMSIEQQLLSARNLPRRLPENHYSRKNAAYLQAIEEGVQYIFDLDDDNGPLAAATLPNSDQLYARAVIAESGSSWVNVYGYFTSTHVWPRGFPLNLVVNDLPLLAENLVSVHAPIQQFLVKDMPDVDAIWRLTTRNQAVEFASDFFIYLPPGMFCPINSQNTLWHRSVFPYLYLPSTCSFRMTDIWRGLIAQRCLHADGIGMVFRSPQFYQDRNVHDNMVDFENEISGYLQNETIVKVLIDLKLVPLQPLKNLQTCYRALVAQRIISADELNLLEAWMQDIEALL